MTIIDPLIIHNDPAILPLKTEMEHIRVIHCIVMCHDKILLLQRRQNMRYYPGYWSGVCGIFDDHVALKNKVLQKIEEEAGIDSSFQKIIMQKSPITYIEKAYGKQFDIVPVLVEVNQTNVKADFNCQAHAWISLPELRFYNVLPGFFDVLKALGLHK